MKRKHKRRAPQLRLLINILYERLAHRVDFVLASQKHKYVTQRLPSRAAGEQVDNLRACRVVVIAFDSWGAVANRDGECATGDAQQ